MWLDELRLLPVSRLCVMSSPSDPSPRVAARLNLPDLHQQTTVAMIERENLIRVWYMHVIELWWQLLQPENLKVCNSLVDSSEGQSISCWLHYKIYSLSSMRADIPSLLPWATKSSLQAIHERLVTVG